MAIREEFKKVWLESDSLNIINCVSKHTEPSWTIKHLIQECHIMVSKLDDFKIFHVYQEGNMPSDHLANIGVDYVDIRWWMGKETFLI